MSEWRRFAENAVIGLVAVVFVVLLYSLLYYVVFGETP